MPKASSTMSAPHPLPHGSLSSLSKVCDFHKIASRVNQIKAFLGRKESVKRLEKRNDNPCLVRIQQSKTKTSQLSLQCRKPDAVRLCLPSDCSVKKRKTTNWEEDTGRLHGTLARRLLLGTGLSSRHWLGSPLRTWTGQGPRGQVCVTAVRPAVLSRFRVGVVTTADTAPMSPRKPPGTVGLCPEPFAW